MVPMTVTGHLNRSLHGFGQFTFLCVHVCFRRQQIKHATVHKSYTSKKIPDVNSAQPTIAAAMSGSKCGKLNPEQMRKS
jgi:hypothetical protein